MKLKKRSPHDPKVIAEAVEMIRQMTPDEVRAFFAHRTPGVEETDMTGMYSDRPLTEETSPIEPQGGTK